MVLTTTPLEFRIAHPDGVIVGLSLAIDEALGPEHVGTLRPQEREACAKMVHFRAASFVVGRLSMSEALRTIGVCDFPVLANGRGAPRMPPNVVGSISHKRVDDTRGSKILGVAIAEREVAGRTIGIDVEAFAPERMAIAQRILTDRERKEIATLPPDRAWRETIARFSIKESVYKALDPFVSRYVGFLEAEVDFEGALEIDTTIRDAKVGLHLHPAEGPFSVHARYFSPAERSDVLITTATITRR